MDKNRFSTILKFVLSINDLTAGLYTVYENAPYQVLEVHHLHIGRGGSSIQTKLKNLKTGQVLARNFKPSDTFEEADIEKKKVKYLYSHRNEYWFSEINNDRFKLSQEQIGNTVKFLKQNTIVEALNFNGEILNITLPIKMDFRVTEAPPAIRGNTAQGGTKTVTIETGAQVVVPLFINEGDIIRLNTTTGEYVERVEKY